MQISGKGNWHSAEILNPIFPPGFDVFDPKISDDVRYINGKLSGTKTYEFVVIPRVSGSFTIPAQEISYFNPSQQIYQVKRARSFQIAVSASDGLLSSGTYSPEEVEILSQDIRFIHSDIHLQKRGQQSILFWVLNCLMGCAFGVGLILQFRQKQLANLDWQAERQKRNALRKITKELKTAKKELKSGNLENFFEISALAIRQYFREKLQISEHETDSENLKLKLGDAASKMLSILERCEAGQYAPGISSKTEDIEQLLVDLLNTLEILDKKL